MVLIGQTVQAYEGLSCDKLIQFAKLIGIESCEINPKGVNLKNVNEIIEAVGKMKTTFHLPVEGIEGYDFAYPENEKEINRIARIVRQMLELYRPAQEIAREFNLDTCIQDIITLLQAGEYQNSVSVSYAAGDTPVLVTLPEDLLRQVLYNLIQNAIEASPRNGEVVIQTFLTAEELQIDIADQGNGIEEKISSQIYEPFFTTKIGSKTGGLGLGLSISKSIVETLRGALLYENKASKGTVFRIVLPLP